MKKHQNTAKKVTPLTSKTQKTGLKTRTRLRAGAYSIFNL